MKACFQIAECSLSSAKILIFFYFMAFFTCFFALFKKRLTQKQHQMVYDDKAVSVSSGCEGAASPTP